MKGQVVMLMLECQRTNMGAWDEMIKSLSDIGEQCKNRSYCHVIIFGRSSLNLLTWIDLELKYLLLANRKDI